MNPAIPKNFIERYSGIVDDRKAFLSSLEKPLGWNAFQIVIFLQVSWKVAVLGYELAKSDEVPRLNSEDS